MIPKRTFKTISPHFSDAETPSTLYVESDAETSLNEDIFDTCQLEGLYTKKEKTNGQAAKIYRTMYEPYKSLYENEILRERRNIQQQRNSSGCGNWGKQAPSYQQQGNSLGRCQEYSYRERNNPGYSYQQTNRPRSDPYQQEEYSTQTANISAACDHDGNSRATRRQGFSYQQINIQRYPYQKTSRPLYSYQQEEYSTQTDNISACDHQGISRVTRRPGVSYLQGNAGGYSYNLAYPDRHHHVQDRAVNRTNRQTSKMVLYTRERRTQRYDMSPPRVNQSEQPPIQRYSRIQQTDPHVQRIREVRRRCGRQELCEEVNQRPVKRNGVCPETDVTQKQRIFVRVLAKRF